MITLMSYWSCMQTMHYIPFKRKKKNLAALIIMFVEKYIFGKCIYSPKSGTHNDQKLQNFAACVLWSCQQRCKIYISLLKSGTHKHQNPKIPKIAPYVLWSYRQKSNIYIFSSPKVVLSKTKPQKIAIHLCYQLLRFNFAFTLWD